PGKADLRGPGFSVTLQPSEVVAEFARIQMREINSRVMEFWRIPLHFAAKLQTTEVLRISLLDLQHLNLQLPNHLSHWQEAAVGARAGQARVGQLEVRRADAALAERRVHGNPVAVDPQLVPHVVDEALRRFLVDQADRHAGWDAARSSE